MTRWQRRREITHAGRLDEYDPWLGTRGTIQLLKAGRNWHYGYVAVAGADLWSILPQIPAPTLIISGERDELWDESQRAVQIMRDATWQPMTNCSHDVIDEEPELFARNVDQFVRRD
jgi:pimeloyl-ACP methyl ester carboxylesterase